MLLSKVDKAFFSSFTSPQAIYVCVFITLAITRMSKHKSRARGDKMKCNLRFEKFLRGERIIVLLRHKNDDAPTVDP